jgi:hypothetical protein
MSEGTKRPRATEPPRQGGGFVTGGEDAWTQQDPDTWAKMGTPNATPLRPADEKRREEAANGNGNARPGRAVISGPPSRPPAPAPEIARMFTRMKGNEDDPSTVVGSTRTPPQAPRPGVARIDGARMEIVNFDGVGARVPGGPASLHDDGPHHEASRLDQMFPGHPPIRIVRRPRKEAAAGRVILSVGVIVALGAFAWHQYDRYLESSVPSPNKVIYTKLEGEEPAAADGQAEGTDAPAPTPAASGGPAAAPVGTLTVTSDRTATVYVDGRAAGQAPINSVRIVMGVHEIKVVDEKTLDSRTQKMKIKPGQHCTSSATFSSPSTSSCEYPPPSPPKAPQ